MFNPKAIEGVVGTLGNFPEVRRSPIARAAGKATMAGSPSALRGEAEPPPLPSTAVRNSSQWGRCHRRTAFSAPAHRFQRAKRSAPSLPSHSPPPYWFPFQFRSFCAILLIHSCSMFESYVVCCIQSLVGRMSDVVGAGWSEDTFVVWGGSRNGLRSPLRSARASRALLKARWVFAAVLSGEKKYEERGVRS